MAVLQALNFITKEEAAGLAAHQHLILQLAKDQGGRRWLKYDWDLGSGPQQKYKNLWWPKLDYMSIRGMVKNDNYVYMDHLSALDSYQQEADLAHLIISRDVWALELSDHSDRIFSKFILDSITNGFWIGFNN